ncbi:MAG: hypothetical protein JWS12_65 [Candidatus Saccharibacteria bacterium]|nr:hypothetical protein [Candidatus Saccharibacteria bacterium]
MVSQRVKTAPQREFVPISIGIGVLVACLLRLPSTDRSLFWREFVLLGTGEISLVYYLLQPRAVHLSKKLSLLLLALLGLSTYSLLQTRPLRAGLLGTPLIHPGLFSLYASVLIGFVFAAHRKALGFWKAAYWVILAFSLVNLLYWLTHGVSNRLGLVGIQINYSALIFVLGIVIGSWLYAHAYITTWQALAAQCLLLVSVALTQSRVEIVLALLVSGWFACDLLLQKFSKTQAWLVLGVIGFVLVMGLSFIPRVSSGSYFGTSVTYRRDLVRAALPTHTSGWILGSGITSLETNIATRGWQYPELRKDLQTGWHFESSHNYVVDLIVERGLIVLGLYLALTYLALQSAWQQKEASAKLLGVLLSCLLVFLLFDNINIQTELLYWVLVIGLLSPYPHSRTMAAKKA